MLLLCALIAGSSSVWADDYKLLTAAPSDWTGDYVVVSALNQSASTFIADGTVTGNNFSTANGVKTLTNAGITYDDTNKKLTGVTDAHVLHIAASANDGKYNITLKGANTTIYLIGNSTTGSSSINSATETTNADWTIEGFGEGGNVYLVGKSGRYVGWNTSYFRAYAASNKDTYKAYIFKKIPAAPTFSTAAGSFDAAFDLTITGPTGTTLKYTTNGDDPSGNTATSVNSNSTVVSIPAATTRVRALAVLNGINSAETDATYTYADNSKENPTFSLTPSSLELEVQEEGTLTLTTNSDGDVTFTSSDPTNLSVDNSVDPKVATVSSNVAGNYTITVSVAASATYNEKVEIVNVTINKKSLDGLMTFAETTPSINLFNTKTYEQTVSGLPADFATSGGSVTYSISSAVATITESVVTASAVGSATVTASASGSSLYNDYETSYTLTITNVLPAGVVFVETFDSQGASGNINTSNCDNEGWTSSGSAYQGTKAVRLATGSADGSITTPALNVVSYGKVTIIAKGWSSSEKGALTLTGTNCTLGTTSISDIPNSNTEYNILFTVTGSNPKITFEAPGGNRTYIDNVIVRYDDFKASVSSAKYATFCDGVARDFSASGITVYKAAADGSKVDLTEIADGIVPANTGVVLFSDEVKNNVAIPVATTDPAGDFSDNEMVGINIRTMVDATASTKTNYILSNEAAGAGFYKATDGKYLGAHKAYLSTANATTAPSFLGFDINNDVTSINGIKATKVDGIVYDLQGRKVAQPSKGLYIVNGKKVVIK